RAGIYRQQGVNRECCGVGICVVVSDATSRDRDHRIWREWPVVVEPEPTGRALLGEQEVERALRHTIWCVRQRKDVQRLPEPVAEVTEDRILIGEATGVDPTRLDGCSRERLEIHTTESMNVCTL